ncbi:MAG: DNA-binding protein, partial [Pseudobutyrivibrio sp.]|nr:DNA-binding protein [Pseudobutyrivibrio sp.]
TLNYWKKYEQLSDNGEFEAFKEQLVKEINDLQIEGMPKLDKLNALVGKYVNIEYPLPSGIKAKFLNDNTTYLGNQLESEIVDGLFFGVIANMDFIMICTYEKDVENPELILFKKR